MVTPLILEKPRLMRWGGNAITDHNRSPLDVSPERIETANRMINGTRRSYIVADKRTFSCSWDNVPHSYVYTVDGFWGANEMESYYNTQAQPFTLELTYGNGSTSEFLVVFDSFSKTINKRGFYDFCDVDMSLVEV